MAKRAPRATTASKAKPAKPAKSAAKPAKSAAKSAAKSLPRLLAGKPDRPERSNSAPVLVAVGASAGGLAAFTELLTALPANLPIGPGIALVVIQHLQPGRPSFLAHLLQRTTAMRVQEIADGVRPAANHIYVLPAGQTVQIESGRLRLTPRPHSRAQAGGPLLPVDIFMRSLAAERKNSAIGVVLSGTASDGTLGLEAIKAEGGITFAQTELSASSDSMPRNAIASGCVDFVLPPADIARELARIANHPYIASTELPPIEISPEWDRGYRALLDLVKTELGMDFTDYRASTLQRRIARRMALHTMNKIADYLRFARLNPAELRQMSEDLLIPATRFFRDPEVFAALQRKVLAPVVQRHLRSRSAARGALAGPAPLRLWSVGCSTGEEAYTLAMLALETLASQGAAGAVALQVFGTDLNPTSVRRARLGAYSADIAQDVSAERLGQFFVRTESGYRVTKALRDVCIFAQHDALRQAPFSRQDVVCCRNVMIYLEPVLQRRLFAVLHAGLEPEGTLVLGSAETASPVPLLFSPLGHIPRKLKMYSKLPAKLPAAHSLQLALASGVPLPLLPAPGPERPGPAPLASPALIDDARREADRLVLAQFSPPGVIVDVNLDVVEFRGHATEFLEPISGAASLNLLRMVRGELGAHVRSAVAKAAKSHAPVQRPGLVISAGERRRQPQREFDLFVLPLQARHRDQPLFLVVFEPAQAPLDSPASRLKPQSAQVQRLRRGLAENQRLLRTLAAEYQAAKQEYQSAYEEIASTNEELQSNNEEIETSKEELQSLNEELNTVNEELRHSNSDLYQANQDLQNFTSAVGVAIVLLDRELRIRRFTPGAAKLLRLIATDTGRRMADIRWNVLVPNLDQLAYSALTKGGVPAQEVQDGEGKWHLLRLHPYFEPNGLIDGVVLSLTDIDALKRSAEFQRQARELAEAVTLAATNPIVLLGKDLAVVRANHPFDQCFGAVAVGAVWEPAELGQALAKMRDGNKVEFRLKAPDGQLLRSQVHRVRGPGDEELLLVSVTQG